MGRAPRAGRAGRPWRTLVTQLKQTWSTNNVPCVLCGQQIDYTLPYTHKQACTVEHIKPWSTHPDLREEPSNLAPAHGHCNISKGAKQNVLNLGQLSREW